MIYLLTHTPSLHFTQSSTHSTFSDTPLRHPSHILSHLVTPPHLPSHPPSLTPAGGGPGRAASDADNDVKQRIQSWIDGLLPPLPGETSMWGTGSLQSSSSSLLASTSTATTTTAPFAGGVGMDHKVGSDQTQGDGGVSGRLLHGLAALPYAHRGSMMGRGGHISGGETDPTTHQLLGDTIHHDKSLSLFLSLSLSLFLSLSLSLSLSLVHTNISPRISTYRSYHPLAFV